MQFHILSRAPVIAGFAVAMSVGYASAQGAAPSLSAPQQQSIQIPNATPTHLAAAVELVAVTGLASSILQVIPGLMGQINSTVTTTRPELGADMKKAFETLAPEFGKYPQEIVVAAARVYTAVMTEQECKDALVFFKGPVGKKFVDVQPTIIGNVNPMIRNWQQQLSVKMMDRVREEMKKLGHDI